MDLPSIPSSVPLVFIHGFKGGKLVDPQGNTQWIKLVQVMGLQTPDLSLPLEWEDDIQAKDQLRVDGALASVGNFVKIYAPWLTFARSLGRIFQEFSYDWRRDLNETTDSFVKFLEDVKERSGESAQVVAHSMGGLITLAALNQRPDLFQSVLFAGVPFQQGIGILKDIHLGDKVGLNAYISSPQVLFTYPSMLSFLSFKEDPKIVDAESNYLDIDLFDSADWAKHRIGIFSLEEKPSEAHVKHLQKSLDRARHFRSHIRLNPEITYPPIAILVSKSHPTLNRVMKEGPQSVRGFDFETMPKVEGDERVPYVASLPPEG